MSHLIHTLERFLEWGGVKKAVTCLVFSGIALLVSIFDLLPQLCLLYTSPSPRD